MESALQLWSARTDATLVAELPARTKWYPGRVAIEGGSKVLRISVEETAESLSLTVEGRLVGPWVDEMRQLCQERHAPSKQVQLTVDLCGLTAMDTRGQALLEELLRRGAALRCSDVMNQYLVEQMAQPAESIREVSRPCRGSASTADLSAA